LVIESSSHPTSEKCVINFLQFVISLSGQVGKEGMFEELVRIGHIFHMPIQIPEKLPTLTNTDAN